MIHVIWILSVLYCIPAYFLFFKHHYHYNIYAIILIGLHRTAGHLRCLLFGIHNTFFVHKTGKTATIHSCILIKSHTPPKIRAIVASSWYTYTKVSALHWSSYYCIFIYSSNIIFRKKQGDCFYSPTLC